MDKNWLSPEEQVEIINRKAHKADTLIILGDIGNVEYVKKLKAGRKVLIMGNHDSGVENYRRVCEEKIFHATKKELAKDFYNAEKDSGSWCQFVDSTDAWFPHYTVKYDNHLFDEVYEGPLFISEKIMLSHEPYELPFAANIHGHDHAGKMYHGHNVNLASNVCGFTPVSLAELIKGGLISKVPTIHRICIDKATKNPIHKKRN